MWADWPLLIFIGLPLTADFLEPVLRKNPRPVRQNVPAAGARGGGAQNSSTSSLRMNIGVDLHTFQTKPKQKIDGDFDYR
jgi:hypothetical protein